MQFSALSQVSNFRSNLEFWSICLLATTIWNILYMNLYSFIIVIHVDRIFNPTEQNRKQGLLNAACTAIAMITTASIAHILWYWIFSPTGLLGTVSPGAYSVSCLITCFGLVLRPTFLDISYEYSFKTASKESQIMFQISLLAMSTSQWFLSSGFKTPVNDDDIEVPLLSAVLYFSLWPAALHGSHECDDLEAV